MKHLFTRKYGPVLFFIGAVLILCLGLWSCSGSGDSPVASNQVPSQSVEGTFSKANPQVQAVMAVQDHHTSRLMAEPDVIGTATTVDENGQPAIMILVTSEAARDKAPKMLDGVRVQTVLTDPIVAMKGKPGGGGGVSHTAKQTPPIKLGASGGWGHDLANSYCCGGTLGALIQVGSTQRILSNYHVFEADIVSGGNGRTASNGDPIIQPGLIDVNCNINNAQTVATLVKSNSLPNSNVDCSSANVVPGMVSATGEILEIGIISSSTVAASVNQAVKKSGRTSGLSRSTVSGLNATVSITYENECAGGTAFTKTFTGQIVVANRRSKFLQGGDSGSLMVEDVTSNPRAVGLLFAGSSTLAIANPIDEVLNKLNATMVGN